MEWVAYLAGEPHTDTPVCVSPILTRFCIAFNDGLPDDERQKLRPYLARTIGTRGDGLDQERSFMCADWLIRTYTPTWLDLAGLDEAANRLRSLPPVLAVENVTRSMDALNSARAEASAAGAAARAAAWAAAWAAARAAAWDAAWAAAGDAAGAAAGAAAWDAAWAAAGAAAWDAAGDAARAAARDALAPTVLALQTSAFDLLDRMLPTEIIQLPVSEDAEAVCGVPIRA
jgi:hypothetical protein